MHAAKTLPGRTHAPARQVAPVIAHCTGLLYTILRHVHGLPHEEAYRRTYEAVEAVRLARAA